MSGSQREAPLDRILRHEAAYFTSMANDPDRFDQVRIDVIGLVYDGTGGFSIEHIRGVG